MTRLASRFLFVHAAGYWAWVAWGTSPCWVKIVGGVALYHGALALMLLLLHREARRPE